MVAGSGGMGSRTGKALLGRQVTKNENTIQMLKDASTFLEKVIKKMCVFLKSNAPRKNFKV